MQGNKKQEETGTISDILYPEGIYIGHADDGEKTGVSVILCPEGATGGVSVRGCAPGGRETDLLRPEKAIDKINAVVLTGGSAFGLAACDGVMRYCREKSIGYAVGAVKVPLVAGGVIFDLLDASYAHPNAETGYSACVDAKNHDVLWGAIGVGTGATAGKLLGLAMSAKTGISAATVSIGEAFVTAVTVVNALGDVIDYKTGKVVAGAGSNGKFSGVNDLILSGSFMPSSSTGGNTTLTCLLTNVSLTKLQINKLADIAHDGFAKSIAPVHTDYDGDTVFALSRGQQEFDFTVLSVMAVEAVCQSIVKAATENKRFNLI